MKQKNNILALLMLFIISAGFGCNQQNGDNGTDEMKKITVYCEESIFDMMKPLSMSFDSADSQGEIVLRKSSGFDAMAKLLAGEANMILLSREYSGYEDSMMTAFSVKPHTRMNFATDALVLYVSVWSDMDTITDAQIKEFLNNPNSSLNNYNKKFPAGLEIVCNSRLSTDYFNLKKFLCNGKNPQRKIKLLGTSDSVKNYINSSRNSIGIGYLSQIVNDSKFRAIAVSFVDSAKNRVFPRVVHQTNIAQRLYPYIITHYAYISDNKQDLQMRFGRFLSKSGSAQRYFNQFGIVPAFAKVKLIEEG